MEVAVEVEVAATLADGPFAVTATSRYMKSRTHEEGGVRYAWGCARSCLQMRVQRARTARRWRESERKIARGCLTHASAHTERQTGR